LGPLSHTLSVRLARTLRRRFREQLSHTVVAADANDRTLFLKTS